MLGLGAPPSPSAVALPLSVAASRSATISACPLPRASSMGRPVPGQPKGLLGRWAHPSYAPSASSARTTSVRPCRHAWWRG
eukprot:2963219-Prymnesium_polylepis.1